MSDTLARSDSPPDPPVLDYGTRTGSTSLPLAVRVAFLPASWAAVASIFLPFTFETSPLDVITDWLIRNATWTAELMILATPFLAGLPIAAWALRRVIRPRLSRAERVVMYAIAVPCGALTAYLAVRVLVMEGSASPQEIAEFMLGPVGFVVGGLLTAWLLRRGDRDAAATTALQTGYAANGVMLLAAMYSPDHPGWWATLVAVTGMAVEAALVVVRALRRL